MLLITPYERDITFTITGALYIEGDLDASIG